MSTTFDPNVHFLILQNAEPPGERIKFKKTWDQKVRRAAFNCRPSRSTRVCQVATHITTWSKEKTQVAPGQLRYAASVCAYVFMVNRLTQPKNGSSLPRKLPASIPIAGPRFTPPLTVSRHSSAPRSPVTPDPFYLRPVTVVHPFYDPTLLCCPGCRKHELRQNPNLLSWDGWNGKGPREVYGVFELEYAIGTQLECHQCHNERKREKEAGVADKKLRQYNWATTSVDYWKGIPHWKIPGTLIRIC